MTDYMNGLKANAGKCFRWFSVYSGYPIINIMLNGAQRKVLRKKPTLLLFI